MASTQKQTSGWTMAALFRALVRRPWLVISIGVALMLMAGAGVSRLDKNPSTDALIPQNHPSIAVRDRAEDIFGLRDPIVIAVASRSSGGVFTPDGFGLIAEVHEAVASLEGVRPDRVKSIASESRISGRGDVFMVERFYEARPTTQVEADAIASRVVASPPHIGTLVAEDGSMALIVAELHEAADGDQVYRAARAIAETESDDGYRIHVAGEGAVTGYLSASIDEDGRRLPAIAAAIIFLLAFLAFRSVKALAPLLLVILAAVAGSIGIMSWLGIQYYVITSALPIILIAIAVADTIHILSGYFARRAAAPLAPVNEIVVDTMTDLWRPLTLTTFTTMAGFFGIALASIMPPLSYFGWFACLGTFLAWAYSLFVLPGVLALMKLPPSPVIAADGKGIISGTLTGLARRAAARPRIAIGGLLAIGCLAAYQAASVSIDRDRIQLFAAEEPIRIADVAINDRMAGTSYLDVLVEVDEEEGLLSADRAARIVDLQRFMEALPTINRATAFTDVASEIFLAVSPDRNEELPVGRGARPLPSDDDALAQLLLLYESSGDPEDIADEIDAVYRHALVRGYMTSHTFSGQRPAVERLQTYLEEQFNGEGLTAQLSGRVNVDYNWMLQLGESHVRSVALSLVLILLMAAVLFRSLPLGLLSVAPVVFAIVSVYAVMATAGIFIEPSTSMFAAIAIGVGVDFAVHFIDRIKKGVTDDGLSVLEAIAKRFPISARACFINAAALGVGFSVLMASTLPTVVRFGLLITVAAVASFFAGLIVTCAILALLKPSAQARSGTSEGISAPVKTMLLLLAGSVLMLGDHALAQPATNLSAEDIAHNINVRDEGDRVSRSLAMVKVSRRGSQQEREAMSFRANDDQGARRSLIVYTAPRSIRGTAFMTHDSAAANDSDRRWLFLPSRGSSMRIPDAERGKYFLGTGFSYEDIKSELKFSARDYRFELADPPRGSDPGLLGLRAIPKTDQIARELGYSALHAAVDPESWMPVLIQFEDRNGQDLKTVALRQFEQIDGIWTILEIEVDHHQKNHITTFEYRDVSYDTGPHHSDFVPENMEDSLDWQPR